MRINPGKIYDLRRKMETGKREKEEEVCLSYPIMARNGEMISSVGSIPVGVLISYNTNIICDQTLELISREGNPRPVDVVDDIGHTYGE